MPTLYIITGSNGAGKSTIGRYFLPEELQKNPIFDGDKLFVQKRNELWASGIRSLKEIRRLANDYTVETFERWFHQYLPVISYALRDPES